MTGDMTPLQGSVHGRIIRGGTSKGFFIRESELPTVKKDLLDTLVLELYGSPDPLQVDGIGGSHSHTSKLMIVRQSEREGVDVDYRFGQIAIEKPVVDWTGNCGNLTSAIGMFAIQEGLINPSSSPAEVTLYNTNTETTIQQIIPLEDGSPTPYGTYAIDGVPGTGARVDSTFLDPAGSVFGSLTPTGNLTESVCIDDSEYEVSLLDVTNPCVFIHANAVSLNGTELPQEFLEIPNLLERIELIRGAVCERLGLVEDAANAQIEQPMIPFIAIVSEPQTYNCSVDKSITAQEIDITARIVTTQTPHHAYAMTGAMCLAAASQLSGTVPQQVVQNQGNCVTIGHPKGKISIKTSISSNRVKELTVSRTAREIMQGNLFYRYTEELKKLA